MSTLKAIFLAAAIGFASLAAIVAAVHGVARAAILAPPAFLLGYGAIGRRAHE